MRTLILGVFLRSSNCCSSAMSNAQQCRWGHCRAAWKEAGASPLCRGAVCREARSPSLTFLPPRWRLVRVCPLRSWKLTHWATAPSWSSAPLLCQLCIKLSSCGPWPTTASASPAGMRSAGQRPALGSGPALPKEVGNAQRWKRGP